MAVCIARVAATGMDLTTQQALDQIAEGFLAWYRSGPPDIGVQTSAVLHGATAAVERGERAGIALRDEAQAYSSHHARSAGNGALMRTGPVALAFPDDRAKLAEATRLVAELTHADPLAGDSCVLWCEAIRVAMVDGVIDVSTGLDLLPAARRDRWTQWVADASDLERNRGELVPGARFTPNGFTVAALQAATAAIVTTAVPVEPDRSHLEDALHNAIRIGNDTDTVAAIAGALLGARWGVAAVPTHWRLAVHGWPGLTGEDLVGLAGSAVG